MPNIKPLALDLCCGKGGWTNGLLAAGWDVIGVDIEDMGGYRGHLVLADVRTLDINLMFPALKFDLVVASPPCQEFSISSQPFKRSRERFNKDNPPDRSIWDACVKIASDLKAPLILENVQGARKWMGPAKWKYGSWYFWGEMPALIPVGCPRKGFQESAKIPFGGSRDVAIHKIAITRNGLQRRKIPFPGEKEGARALPKASMSARKLWAATVAMIPLELSTWIGECFKPREAELLNTKRG